MIEQIQAANAMANFLAECVRTMSIDFGKADTVLAHYRKVLRDINHG